MSDITARQVQGVSMLKPIYIVEGYEQDPNLGKFTRPTILRYDILAYRKDDADTEFERLETEIKKRDEMIESLLSELYKKDEIIINANKKFKEFTDALCRKVLKSKDELVVAVQDAQQDFYEKFIE